MSMLIRVIAFTILIFIVSCAQKANVHEVLGKTTLTVKPILIENKNLDTAIQRVALGKLEEQIKNPPLDAKVKSNVFKRGISVLVGEGSAERFNDYDFLSEKYKSADLLIMMEVKSVTQNERNYVSQVEDEIGTKYFCVERDANATVLFNVFNPKTNQVVFAKSYKGFDYKRYCDKKAYRPDKLPKEELIILKAVERAIGAFVRDFYSIL